MTEWTKKAHREPGDGVYKPLPPKSEIGAAKLHISKQIDK